MSILINNKTIEEILREKILASGGLEKDLKLLTEVDFEKLAKTVAGAGIKSRTPNPAYIVNPVNFVEGIQKHFDWVCEWITYEHCPLRPVEGTKTVELIKCKPGSTEEIRKEIDGRGFYPAPSNYVVGLGVNHPEVTYQYEYIVSLDKNNVFADDVGHPCSLGLYRIDGHNLFLAKPAGEWDDRWWFVVIRK